MRYALMMTAAVFSIAACAPKAGESKAGLDKAAKVVTVTEADMNERTRQATKLIETALEAKYGYAITESLTTEVGQRMAGTEAEARARDWAVAKFKAIGLENVRVEPFTIPGWERGQETASITSPYPQNLEVTALGYSVATPAEGIEAEVVYFSELDALMKTDEDLTGKIAFIDGRMAKAPDGAGYGPAGMKRRIGASEAAKHGAIAVLIRSVGTDSHRFPHTGGMRYAPDVPKIPIAAMSGPDADQIERIFSRGETILSPVSTGDKPSGNVIGEIIGTEEPEKIVVIGGHLDSWDLGTGAIDDGAGIGITAGAAQAIIESGLKPKRTIRVIAYGAEEIGLLGGFAYRDKYKAELNNHVMASEPDVGAEAPYEVQYNWTEGREDMQAYHTHDDTFDKIDADEMAKNTAAFAAMAWITANSDSNYRDSKVK